jgi:apolipoprotein N-acyltransferase
MKKSLEAFRFCFLWILSWAIVGFGQPSWSCVMAILASCCGYSLFWLTLSYFDTKKGRFLHASFWFFCVQAIQLSWMTATEYHGFYILIVYFVILLWFGIQFGLLTLCMPRDLKLTFYDCFFLASIWTLMEWSRLYVLCGFPFNFSGVALTGWYVSSQLASVFGVLGLSFMVMLTNTLGLKAIGLKKCKESWMSYLMVIGFIYMFGAVTLTYHHFRRQKNNENGSMEIALVQTGLKPEEKTPLKERLEKHVSPFDQWIWIINSLKEKHPQHLKLIVLPESALPYGIDQDVYLIEEVKQCLKELWGEEYEKCLPAVKKNIRYVSNAFWVQALANHYECEVIGGFDDYDPFTQENYNAAFHFFPNNQKTERYEKCILVPLAEYLPFSVLKPLVTKYGISEFATHGRGAKVFGNQIPIAISICYEECFSYLIRQGRKQGAHLFVNVTNDGWYHPSKLPQQHFHHGKLRTIENGVPLLRACNTGITAVIDSLGRVQAALDPTKDREIFKGVLVASVPLYRYRTVYTLCGDYLILGISCACIAIHLLRKRVFKEKWAL